MNYLSRVHIQITNLLRFSIVFFGMILVTNIVQAENLCKIIIIEEDSGWPVPLVELKTTHKVKFISDNAGVIAFDLPELMGKTTWFFVEGHGYEIKKDQFGYRGVRLTPAPGKTLTVKVKRRLPAKRLGRITGSGIFGESLRFGLNKDWIDQGILGCDSVQTAVHNGRLHWAWGDTILQGYPLGLFHMISATTDLKPLQSFKPPIRLRYNYITGKSGTPRVVAKIPGEGPTWISGLVSLPDKNGKEHLVGTYVKVKSPLEVYEVGLCVWDDNKEQFNKLNKLWAKKIKTDKPPLRPDGHPVFRTDKTGKKWILFGDPFPHLKCAANFEAWNNPEAWEEIQPQQSVQSVTDGKAIKPHRGSIAWNSYRKKWIAVFTQMHGTPSSFGEIWYTEADHPTGVWGPAVKIVTHNNYTFYNPRLHPEFTEPDSPILLFEATYTKQFANHAEATPRHDYNQILYRIDLDDPKLTAR